MTLSRVCVCCWTLVPTAEYNRCIAFDFGFLLFASTGTDSQKQASKVVVVSGNCFFCFGPSVRPSFGRLSWLMIRRKRRQRRRRACVCGLCKKEERNISSCPRNSVLCVFGVRGEPGTDFVSINIHNTTRSLACVRVLCKFDQHLLLCAVRDA